MPDSRDDGYAGCGPSREEALEVVRRLRDQFENTDLDSLNEATTRLQVIDEILVGLGWSKADFNPETRAGATGFSDYLLSIDGHPRIVVEAKRSGHTFRSGKRLAKTEYKLGYVRSAFGPALTEVLEQARGYAMEHGVPFAALTNGGEWLVVQVIPYPGQDADDLKCSYCGDLLREDGNFDLLWELLSHAAVSTSRLNESFAELNATEFEYSGVPRQEVGALTWRREFGDAGYLEEFYRLFMDEIVDPARRLMLQHCFVTSARLDQYEGNLKRVLRDTAPPYIEAERDLAPGDHGSVIPGDSGDQRGRVVLVTGSVGCGKTTFVTKILIETRKEKRSHSLMVNLIDVVDEPPVDVNGMLWDRVLEQWRDQEEAAFEYETLKAIFHKELGQLRRGPHARVFEANEEVYRNAEAELLSELSAKPEKYLPRCWRHYRSRLSKGVVVFLDNVDRASEEFQRRAYAFAHGLAADTGATVIVPMREMTYFRGKSAGFLDIRSNDVVYHLQAPDPVKVVSKRIRYVETWLEDDHRYRRWKAADNSTELLSACRGHARVLKQQLLESPAGRQIVELASSVAWHDIRTFLTYVQQVHGALKDSRWTQADAVAALLVPREAGARTSMPNLYSPPQPYAAYPCTFTKARALALLLYSRAPDRVKQGLPLTELLRVLRLYGYRDRWSRRAVEDLVRDRLLECLEAPAAAEFTKSYSLQDGHSFRPSPLAVTLVERVQHEPAYLAIVGADITFHSRKSYDSYVECVRDVVEAAGERQLDAAALALLVESSAPGIVGSHLRNLFAKERPLQDLPKYVPEVAGIETPLTRCIDRFPRVGEEKADSVPPPPAEGGAKQMSLGLDDQDEVVGTEHSKGPMVPLPESLLEVRIGQSTLGPAIFWALAELQAQGKSPATGATITDEINRYVFSDQERKEPTNVSRALRQPLLRQQGWLAAYGKKGAWRYGLSSSWRREWRRLFREPAPPRTPA